MFPLSALSQPIWLNDEGYADDDARPDSRMHDVSHSLNDPSPASMPLPESIVKMPDAQRTGMLTILTLSSPEISSCVYTAQQCAL
jgi:hypothetical protein